MTASVLKQDPNKEKAEEHANYQDKTQHVNLWGNPLYQAQNGT